jgi:pimeloyl-ACP methyl ester carboxylesterase
VTADLLALLDALDLPEPPIVAGQSWGGNVALDFAARYPGAARGIVLVDGGTIELSAWPGSSWERVERDLAPPDLAGTPREELRDRLRRAHPGWSEEGIEHTLANFETLPDGTVRPWLTRERHMAILRALGSTAPRRCSGA